MALNQPVTALAPSSAQREFDRAVVSNHVQWSITNNHMHLNNRMHLKTRPNNNPRLCNIAQLPLRRPRVRRHEARYFLI
jgi:hypothetical protein